ncbi:MAG: hypothetical protein ACI9HK_003004, partial [Pirellulaceae bacterium]
NTNLPSKTPILSSPGHKPILRQAGGAREAT